MPDTDFEAKAPSSFPIVGLGASAGGLEAYEDFFSHLPAKPACAFVLIMHLDPDHKSMLPDLIGKATGLQVVQAEDGMQVEPGRIHIIPPNTTMFLRDGTLRLEKPAQGRGMRRPIDDFFRSLAEELGPSAVGIIFSGTGSDGTQGLREIKFAGGVSMVQEPSSAKYESMPLSAKNAGVVDVSLPAAELAERFSELLKKRGYVHVEVDELEDRKENEQLNEVLEEVHAQTGRDLSHYKRTTLMRRIEKRMLLNEQLTLPEYRKLLESNEAEVRSLLKEMQIGVTSFFRDEDAFQVVEEQVLPRLFAAKQKKDPIRIWVPGCATGEEAYSLAMLFAHYMEQNKDRRQVQMFGTDIDEESIAKARAAVYPASAVADVPQKYSERYFRKQNGDYALTSEIREMIVLAPHNVIENPPFFKLDFISCRNLLIYLTPETQKKVIPLFFYALLPERFLLLGPAETLGSHSHLFTNIDSKWKVFQRKDIPDSRVEVPLATKGVWRGGDIEKPPRTKRKDDYAYILRDAMAETFGHPCVLLSEDDEVVQIYGDVHDFLGLASGDPTKDVYRLARDPLRLHLRSAVHKARKDKEQVVYQGIAMDGDEPKTYDLVVAPVSVKNEDSGLVLVSFRKDGGDHSVQPMPEEVARDTIVQQLEEELRISNEKLQATVEDLESANEELKSSNEELMSMNEELQSTNEELETSQEELQALNEELSTVNSELQAKISELDEAKSDLENLLAASDIATLFVDEDMVIRQFTPAATSIFRIVNADVGRPLKDFANRTPGENVIADTKKVLKNRKMVEKEVQTEDGKWYLARFHPYEDQKGEVSGVVLTYVDITEKRQVEEELRKAKQNLEERVEERTKELAESQNRLQAIVDNFPNGAVLLYDHDLRFLVASGQILDDHEYDVDSIIGQRLPDVVRPEVTEILEPAYRAALRGESPHFEITEKGEVFDVWIVPVRDEDGEIQAGLVMAQLVTQSAEMKRSLIEARNMAQAANTAKSAFLANMSHEIRSPLTGILGIAQLLKMNPHKADVEDLADKIMQSGQQLLAIINDILDISRIEADRVILQPEPADLRDLVDQVHDLFAKQAADKGLDMRVEIADTVPDFVELDPTRFTQILTNLVGNAVKFTSEGHIEIRLDASKTAKGVDLNGTVSDTGVGIPADQQQAIFESFHQAENYLTKAHPGTGLGLAITHRLLELMGGELTVESEHGEGSVFSFTLPGLQTARPEDGATSDEECEDELKEVCPLHILVVEDNKINRYFITEMLKAAECDVSEAENGRQALSMLESGTFDVVLMDVQMPEMDGIETTRRIREADDEKIRNTKIIAMTAYAMPEDRVRLLEAGMDEYLSKPVDLQTLADTLKEMRRN